MFAMELASFANTRSSACYCMTLCAVAMLASAWSRKKSVYCRWRPSPNPASGAPVGSGALDSSYWGLTLGNVSCLPARVTRSSAARFEDR